MHIFLCRNERYVLKLPEGCSHDISSVDTIEVKMPQISPAKVQGGNEIIKYEKIMMNHG